MRLPARRAKRRRCPIGWGQTARLSSPWMIGASLEHIIFAPTKRGGGDHVANCGYMTDPVAAGQGVARRKCEHSLALARLRGFRAMQFNFVVSTNERAVHLWRSLGFDIVGRLPLAFRHPSLGYVDALVMFRAL
jgi:ribosomal protein S18 acetylase RimI-like enzyme